MLYLAAVTVISEALHPLAWAQSNRPKTTPTAPQKSSPHRSPPRPRSATAEENNRRFEQKLREAEQKRRVEQTELARKQQQRKQSLEKPAPPFNPAAAPAPIECFNAYVAAARSASSMQQLLGYLVQSKQNQLSVEQAEYDPKAEAEQRKWYREKHPKATQDDLNQRFASPFAKVLRYHKTFVGKIIEVQKVAINGNTAHITVLMQGGKGIDGKQYAYGKADVELVGEGNFWKMKDYSDSAWLFD